MTADVPLTSGEITDEWLTARLREAGHDCRVTDLRMTPIGNGQIGSTYRLEIAVVGDPETPCSLVLKQAPSGERSRRVGATGYGFRDRPGFFEQEVLFYAHYAQRLSIDTPRCLFAWVSTDGADFILLMEDIVPATPGDEFHLADPAWLGQAVHELAGLHGPYWGRPATMPHHRLHAPTSDEAILFADRLRKSVAVLEERGLLDVAQDERRLISLLADHAEAWFAGMGTPASLVHGDFRLDNLMFSPRAGGVRAVTVDWQTFSTSFPYRDLGQVLGASIATEVRRRHQDEYLETYASRLRELGVVDASADTTAQLLRVGVLHPVHSALALLRGGYADERGNRLARTWLARSTAAAHDLDTWSAFS
jgi:Phosphotransferase enzyme family